MKECKAAQELIERYLAGESEPAELVELHRHSNQCLDCQRLIELHAGLLQDAKHIPEPSPSGLDAMRQGVLARVVQDESAGRATGRGRSFLRDLYRLLRTYPLTATPLAAVFLFVALLAGRFSATPSSFNDRMFIQEIQQQVSAQQDEAGYADIPFSYNNVSGRPQANGRLKLAFDVCRHVNIQTQMDSPLAKDVLMHAILDPSAMGSRMRAMQLTLQIQDARLEDALVFTMHNDPNLAVRLEALSVLTRHPDDLNIQNALLRTLQQDESVQMRLLALDSLAGKRIDFETIRRTIQTTEMAGDAAIMQRAIKLTNSL